MKEIKFYKMSDYCFKVKEYFEAYNKHELNIQIYGDAAQELRDIINDPSLEGMMFILAVEELIGSKTRVLQGNYDVPFLSWIGGEESFTKEHFIQTMQTVWPDL